MATNWSKESTTKASSTGSTTSTSFQLDSGESFLVKNSSSSNIMSLAESSGNLDVTGTINLGSSSYMTLNNNEIDVSSGDLTVDVAGDILLDAAGTDIKFQVGGTSYLTWNAGGILKMLEAGDTNDYFQINVGGGNGATTISTVDAAGTNAALTLDVDGNILFDTATNEINLKDNGTYFARFKNVGTNLEIQSGASSTTALTFSGANATFAGNLTVSGGITVAGASAFDIGDSDKLLLGDSDDFQLYHDGSNSYITNSTGALKLATESSGIAISIGHTTSETTINDNLTVTGTTSINGASIGVDSDSVLAQSTGTGTSNTLFGKNAGDSIASGGNYNTLFGEDAGTAISTGDNNVMLGYGAGKSITTTTGNTYLGYAAGYSDAAGSNMIGIGGAALYSVNHTDANGTVAIGVTALEDLTSGGYNVSIGHASGANLTTGDYSTFVGYEAGKGNGSEPLTGESNTCIGFRAGYDLEAAGARNTLVGANTGGNITTGLYNVCVGQVAGLTMTTTTGTVLLGYNAGGSIDSADANYTVAIGYNSMSDLEDGASNTAVGQSAGKSITTGGLNVAIGTDAMKGAAAITGGQNVVIGAVAGYDMTGDCAYNVLIGSSAGTNLTTADYNTIIGAHAGLTLTTAANNTFIGYRAGTLTTGDNNTLIGYQAGDEIAAGVENVALGALALSNADNNESRNTAIGYLSLQDLDGTTQYTYNTAVGYGSGKQLTSGVRNTLIGANAGDSLTTADYQTMIGYESGTTMTTGSGNVAVGYQSLSSVTTNGSNADGKPHGNTAVGWQALQDMNQTDQTDIYGYNTAIGYEAGKNLTTATTNTHVGSAAGGVGIITGAANTTLGYGAGYALTSGAGNTFLGSTAGAANTTGTNNIAIGHNSFYANIDGDNNIAIGYAALYSFEADADGHGSNIAIGKEAGQFCTTGTDNTFVGANAGRGITGIKLTGDSNVCIGYSAGILLQGDSDQNVLIGYKAGENITVSDSNIFIGANSGNTTVNGHSNIMIGNNCETSASDSNAQYVIGINLNATANDAVFIGDVDDHIRCDWATDSTWDKVSDKRKKNVLGESPLGLDFINDLNTVQFTFKAPSEYPEEWTSYNKDKKEPRNTEVQHGLLAQDVKKAMDNVGIDTFSGWSEDPDGCQRIGESAFVIPLIKAVQELSNEVNELKAQLKEK